MIKFKAILIRLFVRLLSLLPLIIAQIIGAFCGLISYVFKLDTSRITRINLGLCFPDLSSKQRDKMTRNSLMETGKVIAEMGICWLRDISSVLSLIKNVRNEEVMINGMAKKNGVIIIAPHIGNWEILNLYVVSKYPVTVLYQPPKIVELDDFVRSSRERAGSGVVPTNRKGVGILFQKLKHGEAVGILPDQEPPREAGVFVPFFNTPALSMQLIVKLAKKTGAQVVCGFAKRLPRGQGFEIIFLPADEAIYSDDTQVSVTAMNKSIENCIKHAPEQYQWEYKRFKSGVEGKTRLYQKNK